MKASDFNLQQAIKLDPNTGIATFSKHRIVIFDADSIGRLMQEMIDIGGTNTAKVLMRRFGEANGHSDARLLKEEFAPDDDMNWIALGPTIHTWEGIVKATPTALEYDRATGKFFMQGTWENSFIAEQYIKIYGKSKEAVCWLLSGYATGYCTEFFGKTLMCKETMCVAKGDPHCQFTIKPPEEWD